MVFADNNTKVLAKEIFGFLESNAWKEHVEFWEEEEHYNTFKFMNALKQYFIDDILPKNDKNEATRILDIIESLRAKYSSFPENSDEGDIDNAVCTVFLESLLNWASNGKISYESFIPYLGPLSKKYCKEWDKFTGVRSPGLWTDQEWDEANK